MVSAFDRARTFAETRKVRSDTIRLRSPLRWWKLIATASFSDADIDRLARALARESRDVLDQELIAEGVGEDGMGALRCSLNLFETLDRYGSQDLAMSWSLLAVARGRRIAALSIIAGYRDLIAQTEFHRSQASAAGHLVSLSHLYERLLDWVEIAELNDVVRSTTSAAPLPKAKTVSSTVEPGPTLQPTARISDAGRRGTEFQRQYEGLTREIPLRGGSIDLDRAEMALSASFPWLLEVIDAIMGDLRLRTLARQPYAKFRPTLLIGPPGVGKTAFVFQLASILGLPLRVIAGGATTHTADLTGLSRIYESSQPSVVAQTMLYEKTANPIVVIDEVDKARSGLEYGRFVDALLTFLEPETARCVPDECLLSTIDYSAVSWILTANEASFVTKPLRDRVRILHVGLPAADHWPAAFEGLLQSVAREFECEVDELPEFPPQITEELYQMLTRGISLRAIRKSLIAALAAGLRPPPRH